MSKRVVAAVTIPVLIAAGLILLVAIRPPRQPIAAVSPISPPIPSSGQPTIPVQGSGPNTTASGTVDTSNWTTYRDDEYGFELKYPADLAIATTSYENLYNLGHAFQVQLGYPGLDDQVVITDYLDALVQDVIKSVHLSIVNQEERTTNNIDWHLYAFREAAAGLDFEFSEAFTQHGSSTFRVGTKGQAYPFDQMLSTFEFVRQ